MTSEGPHLPGPDDADGAWLTGGGLYIRSDIPPGMTCDDYRRLQRAIDAKQAEGRAALGRFLHRRRTSR